MFRSTLLLVAILFANLGFANGFETVQLSNSNFTLNKGQVRTIHLNDWRYVQKLYISSYGIRNDGMFEVITNGDVKGTIFVPGRDPSYVVTIGETIRTIQLRHKSGANIKILSMKMVQGRETLNRLPYERDTDATWLDCRGCQRSQYSLPVRNQAAALAREAISLSQRLKSYANYNEYGLFLLPIKKIGARALSVSNARGDLSATTYQYLIALKQQIECSFIYLDETFERDAAFEIALELMTLAREIDELLD